MSKLALLNYIVQFLFIRIAKCEEKVIKGFKLQAFSMTETGIGCSGKIEDYEVRRWYSIHAFILPLTGWINGYIFIGKPFFYRITKVKIS